MISVVMSVYNGERWVGAAIQSVLAQTFDDFEFLIVDDGSTDSTPRIVADFARRDGRIKVIRHPNQGIARSRNAALAAASHEWVAWIDADDVMAPNRLERQVAFIEKHPELAVASCFAHYVNERGRIIGHYTNPLTSEQVVRQWLESGRVIHFIQSGAICRRDVLLEAGGYRPEHRVTEDTDLWNRVAERGHQVRVQPEALMQVRIHDSSVTRSAALAQAREFRWLETNARRRRAGLDEQVWEDFMAAERALPWPRRANLRRRDLGHVLYKSATVARTRGMRARMMLHLTGSLLLSPSYCIGNIWQKTAGARLTQALEQAG